MHGDERVTVLIPALDEEACIGDVVRAIPRNLVDEVVVIDNGSTDCTAEVARDAGATVLHEPTKGYGHALMRALRSHVTDGIVVFMDGDSADDPADLPALLAPFTRGADLVLGQRDEERADEAAKTWPQRLGNRLVLRLVAALFGRRFRDLGPFRAIRAATLRDLQMAHLTYGWTVEMQAKAVARGLQVEEVSVRHRVRLAGESKVSGNARAVLRAGVVMPASVVRLACSEGVLRPSRLVRQLARRRGRGS